MGAVALGLGALGAAAWVSGTLAVRYASSAASEPCPALSAGDHVLHVDDRPPLLLHVPRGATHPRPLLLALHGAGETGADFAADTGFSRLADEEQFIVAYPSAGGPDSFWNMSGQVPGAPDHVRALSESLDDIESAACVDRARVFATGVSNGAGMTARLACDESGRLAGIAAVAGGYRALPPCRPARALPVLEIHGTGDAVVPYGGRPPDFRGSVARWLAGWRRIDGCRGPAERFSPQPGVTELAWKRCAARTEVAHVRLDRVPHGWPGGPATRTLNGRFAATWRTWQFFRSLPARPPAI